MCKPTADNEFGLPMGFTHRRLILITKADLTELHYRIKQLEAERDHYKNQNNMLWNNLRRVETERDEARRWSRYLLRLYMEA